MNIKYGKLALFAAFVFFMAGCRLTTTDIKATLYNKVAPGMLEIPVNATSVSFLQGRWYAIAQSKDRAYGQKIEEYFDFDPSVAGTVQIKEKMTRQYVQERRRQACAAERWNSVAIMSAVHLDFTMSTKHSFAIKRML